MFSNNTICIELHFENEAFLFFRSAWRNRPSRKQNVNSSPPPARTNNSESGCNFEQPSLDVAGAGVYAAHRSQRVRESAIEGQGSSSLARYQFR